MSKSKIEWNDRTWNPVTGCTPISEGCANCYAKRMSARLAGRCGYPKDDPFRVTFHPDKLDEPMHWRKPQRVFVCSMGDLFHPDVPFMWINDIILSTIRSHQHTYILLTKRPERMARFFKWLSSVHNYDPRNLWLGVTAENQARADERIPILLQIPAAVRFVSVEPMLERIKIKPHFFDCGCGQSPCICKGMALQWVIAGRESGPKARPCDNMWIYDLWKQCDETGVPFFDKRDELCQGIREWPEVKA